MLAPHYASLELLLYLAVAFVYLLELDLIILFCECTPYSCDAHSDATVPGELPNV